jgi:hypothetical protein
VFQNVMKHTVLAGLCLALFSGTNVLALSHGNPSQQIATRNVFGLRPAPTPRSPVPPITPEPLLPEIRITGITTLLGTPRALFQYEDKETKRVEFPPLLAEGERYKAMTVLGIDVATSRVRIQKAGTETTLDFIHDGVKPVTLASPAVAPTVSPPPPRLPATPAGRVIIGGFPAAPASPPRPSLQPSMSREEAEAMIEMAREKIRRQEQAGQLQRGGPGSAILPPTRLGEALKQPPGAPTR